MGLEGKLMVLFVLVLAFVIAAAGTAFHQATLSSYPVGIVLALAAVLLGSIEARSKGKRRYLFPIVLGMWVLVFSQDWTGDKLIPANELGFIWTYGSVVTAAAITLWPALPNKRM
jgi:hypothetical protein